MSERKVTPLDPKAAYAMMEDDPRTVLIDVRSQMEFLWIGHPKGAIHVPWIDEPDWVINPNFAREVRKLVLGGAMDHDNAEGVPVVLICRSGKRSLDAGKALLAAGFTHVFHVDEGFEGELDDGHHRSTVGGWRFHNLPWEQC
jgi:rhodanese-related sulfurtransferase